MDAGNKFPPKSLLHLTHLRTDLIDNSFPGEHVRTTGIMHRDVVEELPEEIKCQREKSTPCHIGSMNAPTQHHTVTVAAFPTIPALARIPFPLAIQAPHTAR